MPKIERRLLGHFLEVLGLGDFFNFHSLAFYKHLLRLDVMPLSRSPEARQAFEAAAERRRKINNFLERSSAADVDTQPLGFLPRSEFIETQAPSEITGSEFESLGEAHGQRARLNWQINNVALLLADRVVDYVVQLRRSKGVKGIAAIRLDCARDQQFNNSAAPYLSPFDTALRRFGWMEDFGRHTLPSYYQSSLACPPDMFFPWRVVIETTDPQGLRQFFEDDILRWLAIGVDLAPARNPPQRTSSGQLLDGIIGGIFVDERHAQAYGLTCAHAVSPSCSLVAHIGWRGGGAPDTEVNEPDAALLYLYAPPGVPWSALNARSMRSNGVMASDGPEASARTRPTTQLSPSARTMRHGVIFSPLLGYNADRKLFRVPSLDIKPYTYPSFRHFLRAPFRTTFSQPGDSGSWVMPVDSDGSWYGMVCANERKFRSSYAIDSQFLKYYFAGALGAAPNDLTMKAFD
ncbi:hypothetical protein ABIB73_000280 [Bradyrhizobium sp. F1.4.3]|uniref:hypothetical protein n=1 Tax=Bradyrhizobium sp. F1.4.3 TaxID=3156356 RepID=UPI0033957DB3